MTSTATPFVSPRTPIDLTNCDREPIHIPGAIQPHGVLLGVRESDRVVIQASANAGSILAKSEVVGQTLAALLGDEASATVFAELARGQSRSSLQLATSSGAFATTVHYSDRLAIIELEAAVTAEPLSVDVFRETTRNTLANIERALTLRDLAGAMASQMREITGFDRVWVYRFHEDWHGEIIGESKAEGIEPWLGLHYPASDIPAQARALFLKNWLRMIPDTRFRPVPLEPVDNPLTGQPLDLGNSVLRSVSPIHIEYLSNMGVTASLVISLIHRGQLWGLISGHHYSGPKHVPMQTRTLCEFLAQALSLHVGLADQVEDRERALDTRLQQSRVRARLVDAEEYRAALMEGTPNLMDVARSTGAAVCDGDDCVCIGKTPTSNELSTLIEWLRAQNEDVFSTSALSRHFPPAKAWTDTASGLLAIALSPKRPHYLLWFRGEQQQTIRWAGDPTKPVTVDSATNAPRLSPRGSFARWEEERRGTSDEWSATEIDVAVDLRRTLLDLLLAKAEEVAAVNMELEAANLTLSETAIELETQAEELMRQREEREELLDRERSARSEAERANRAKADFLAMMSHELRTPLNAIGGYAQMMEMGVRGPVTSEQTVDLLRIQQSQRHLLALINNILNFARVEAGQVPMTLATLSVQAILSDVETLVLPQLRAKRLTFEAVLADASLHVRADLDKVRQILLNLVSNSIKFTGDGGAIRMSAFANDDVVGIEVHDTGKGIPADRLREIFEPFVQIEPYSAGRGHEGVGLGLAISRELARSMGGNLVVTSTVSVGSNFTLTLPRAAV